MGQASVRPGYKRFYIPLHQKTFERLIELLTEMGAPIGTSSRMIDEYVHGMVALFEHLKQVKEAEGKEPTFLDAMTAFGKMIEASGVNK